jgi:hypothetical protein
MVLNGLLVLAGLKSQPAVLLDTGFGKWFAQLQHA